MVEFFILLFGLGIALILIGALMNDPSLPDDEKEVDIGKFSS